MAGKGNPNWTKGKSGNPGGRPKQVKDVRDLAREHTATAIERLIHWALSDQPNASVAACKVLLERGWGHPDQRITHDGKIDLVGAKERLEALLARLPVDKGEDESRPTLN